MKSRCTYVVIVLVLAAVALRESAAQPLVQQTFNVVLAGDDPFERFTLDLAYDR